MEVHHFELSEIFVMLSFSLHQPLDELAVDSVPDHGHTVFPHQESYARWSPIHCKLAKTHQLTTVNRRLKVKVEGWHEDQLLLQLSCL